MPNAILDAARAKRDKLQTDIDTMLEEAGKREEPGFTDDEAESFTEKAKARKKLDKQIPELEAEEERAEKATAASAAQADTDTSTRAAVVTAEAMTYDKYGSNSYVRDLAVISASGLDQGFRGKASDALDRLNQHRKEIDIEARSSAELRETLREIQMTPELRTNPNTTDGTGGEFVPPLWLVNQYVPFARAGRVIANRMPTHPLPPGTDSINMPKVLTGTATAIQAAQADNVQSTDMTTSAVSAAVNTIAGQQDVSMQLLDQSPINMDQVIFDDLSADYDKQLDKQVIGGTGANGQHLGIFAQTAATANTTSALNTDAAKINAVTCASVVFYDGQATSFTQYRSVLNGITNIETLRFRSPSAIYAHPRRINSWQIASDATIGRPLYVGYGPFNALGQPNAPIAQGVAGELAGLPVVKDANIPILCATGSITSGSGDMIGLVCEEDMLLWEGNLRMRVLPEVLSGKLQVRIQIYAYSAFMPNRYPAGTSLVTGTTGLAAAAY